MLQALTNVTFDIEYKDALAKLRTIPDRLEKKAIKPALRNAAKLIRKDAERRLFPISRDRHGRLRSEGAIKKGLMFVSMRDKPGYPVKVLVGITKKSITQRAPQLRRRKDRPYWIYLERGTSKQAARPFLEPAFRASDQRTRQMIAAYIQQAVRILEHGG